MFKIDIVEGNFNYNYKDLLSNITKEFIEDFGNGLDTLSRAKRKVKEIVMKKGMDNFEYLDHILIDPDYKEDLSDEQISDCIYDYCRKKDYNADSEEICFTYLKIDCPKLHGLDDDVIFFFLFIYTDEPNSRLPENNIKKYF